ncbi:solute carrier family 22 member 8 isoform X3 [Zalophus californianus]|uniref:Solute carrier family 22 member 8 isoform X3 n=1 Tax=Zalophus californianus TaxID=9704 RepID=A0A6J2BV01_ZALCA|nr:solute carrier family 22 member 8 isoform X3 [Zalophus californianus]
MAFSELMDRVGSKGPFQFLNTILLSLPILGLANHYLLQIFTATTPDHHCRPPPNASTGPWVLPKGLNGKAEKCLRFIDPPNATMPNDTQGATEPCLDGWAYDLSTADSIVTEWDLVCESRRLKEVAQSVFMAGTLIGGIVLGDLSDRFGRKPILTCSYLLLAASGSGAAFSPNVSIYMVFRFLCGWSISGIVLSTVILNVECLSIQMRAIMSTLTGYFYTCGQFILPGLAYAIPQWRWLQLTVSIPFFAFFLLSWWIPESVRWMVLSGKFSKALKILRQIAALNGKKEEGKKLSVEVFHRFWLLQSGYGCGRIWSQPLHPPAHLWWGRHPSQVHHCPLYKLSRPTRHPGRFSTPGRRVHLGYHLCALRLADPEDSTGCVWEGLPVQLLQLPIPLHDRAIPHSHPANRYGHKQLVDPCRKHVSPAGENHRGVAALHPQYYIWDRHPPWRQCRLLPA